MKIMSKHISEYGRIIIRLRGGSSKAYKYLTEHPNLTGSMGEYYGRRREYKYLLGFGLYRQLSPIFHEWEHLRILGGCEYELQVSPNRGADGIKRIMGEVEKILEQAERLQNDEKKEEKIDQQEKKHKLKNLHRILEELE